MDLDTFLSSIQGYDLENLELVDSPQGQSEALSKFDYE